MRRWSGTGNVTSIFGFVRYHTICTYPTVNVYFPAMRPFGTAAMLRGDSGTDDHHNPRDCSASDDRPGGTFELRRKPYRSLNLQIFTLVIAYCTGWSAWLSPYLERLRLAESVLLTTMLDNACGDDKE